MSFEAGGGIDAKWGDIHQGTFTPFVQQIRAFVDVEQVQRVGQRCRAQEEHVPS
ncbi:hypothetical protein SCB71_15750 [Herbiconiux sp. KACC 21604]|uniref:hypothetical protein n=1 Tax=unclassified Herbiconiux TaxID=2618217 RepID=UPI0014922C5A|nr:hypothetical protein [Herbiconiux sp. SALV-R1]QJU54574.1 hypothetical protein HL652_13695 [Herbiconiux sp. SALV-R1]WPO85659.1 hypothetical protein SCB71_15750 [Herbiconiux sp. KACC 21604]